MVGCCKSEAIAQQVVVDPPPPPPPEESAKDTTSVKTESSMKSEHSCEDFFLKGQPEDGERGDEQNTDVPSEAGDVSATNSSTLVRPTFSTATVPSASISLDCEETGEVPWVTSTAVDKPGTAPAKMSQHPTAPPSYSKFTSNSSRSATGASGPPQTVDESTFDTDDEVTTVYSEATRVTGAHNRVRSEVKVKALPTLEDVTIPEGAYVMLPNVRQRGYEPWGIADYSKTKFIRQEPYKVGSLVWFRREGKSKFKWYIPGRIKNYVFDGDDHEVIGYEIDIDCDDETMNKYDDEIVAILKKASPVNTMLRWDEKVPPCPIPGIESTELSSESSQARIDKARETYGDDFGFEGAAQNGIGPAHWGITMEQISELRKDSKYRPDMTMYDVVKEIIKPKTAGTGMGYALSVNKDNPLRAKVMVSHAWGEKFEQFISALKNGGTEGPFWICALSIYQNEDIAEVTIAEQLGPKPESGPFATVLKQVDQMVAIMTQSCDIYTRLWCVYEIFIAITMKVPVSLLAFNEITTSGGGSDAMYSNAVLDSSGKPVVTCEATCGMKADQDMIQGEIVKSGGFEVIDDAVMWVRIKALTDDMEQAQMRSWMETMEHRPIGSCSASNIVARQNAGIADAIQVWEKAKVNRGSVGKSVSTDSWKFINSQSTAGLSDADQAGQAGKQSTLEAIQEKFLCGGLCF